MKNLAFLFFLIIFALTAYGQTPKPTPKKTPKTTKTVVPKLGTETEEFDKAKAVADAAERIAALQAFIKNFPASTEILRAQGLIVSARAQLGDAKLRAGETQTGIDLFKLAVTEAPAPVPDDLFTKVILGFPINLDSLGQRGAAFDVAKMIEEKVGANAAQILDLSKFYINVKYGTEAIRLAQKAVELAPASASAYQVLAIANRLNFRLEDAANAYAKSLELDNNSVINKLSLAEMKRALGKPEEAVALYREILEKDAANPAAQTGLALALFDGGKQSEAEAEMKKSLDAEPKNVKLLTGAAYWYAAHGNNEAAIEFSQKAAAVDPSFVWLYIAQARALMAENKPLEAEKILLAARRYADFPTLDYELASARLAAGLFREAAETLKKNFVVNKEGRIETYIGNRILADADSFTELLSLERRIDLFETKAADSEENTNRLRALLGFQQKLDAPDATETEIAAAADDFAKGGDNMRLHRQLFAAERLLQKKIALPKVLELMQSAIGGVDSALNVPAPSAAVLADEIYTSRQYAISQNLIVVVPDIPRQTLSAILRGRIEDLAGWTYFQQNNPAQSVVRLKRALSVLPDKSAWWRASGWRLGKVLETDGKDKEALDAYLKSYDKELPDPEKRAVIEALYQKVNGNTDGLDARIGAKSETSPAVAETENKPAPANSDNGKTPAEKAPYSVPVAETTPTPKTEATPPPSPEIKPEVKTDATPQPSPEVKTDPQTGTKPATNSLPENVPSIAPKKTPETSPTPDEKSKTEIKSEPTPKTEVQPTPEPSPKTDEPQITETKPAPSPETSPTPQFVAAETKPENKTTDPTTSNTPKPLFDPVIINVGKTDTPKTENSETKPADEKPAETVQKTEPAENKPDENKPDETKSNEKILTGENRPRIIITDNTGAKTTTEEISSCKIIVNQEKLSLLNGGGSLGVEVSFDGDGGDLKQISGASSSPSDVEVTLDPDIFKGMKKLFFVVKSVSAKTGVFTVTFEAPCGKKELLVTVR
jgi:tetratricopeptide (TPR) repeat protein